MSLQAHKIGTVKMISQAFWFIGSFIILLLHSSLKTEVINAITALWLAFVAYWIVFAIFMALFRVADSRVYAQKRSKDIEMFRDFSEHFDLCIVTIPFFGIFIHKIRLIRRLSEELSGQIGRAFKRKLVSEYSRG